MMYYAVHMEHKKTGEKRAKKIKVESFDETWVKGAKYCGYNSVWEWKGTEPFKNIEHKSMHIGGGFYKPN